MLDEFNCEQGDPQILSGDVFLYGTTGRWCAAIYATTERQKMQRFVQRTQFPEKEVYFYHCRFPQHPPKGKEDRFKLPGKHPSPEEKLRSSMFEYYHQYWRQVPRNVEDLDGQRLEDVLVGLVTRFEQRNVQESSVIESLQNLAIGQEYRHEMNIFLESLPWLRPEQRRRHCALIQSVADENYERAAQLRDLLRQSS